jgi:hypothetical protein
MTAFPASEIRYKNFVIVLSGDIDGEGATRGFLSGRKGKRIWRCSRINLGQQRETSKNSLVKNRRGSANTPQEVRVGIVGRAQFPP